MTISAHHPKLACLILALGIAAGAVPIASAQTDTKAADAAYVPTLTFDVVSIRESKDDKAGSFTMSGDDEDHTSLVTATNYHALDLIVMAYNIDRRNISGGPAWTSSTLYYLKAKSDSSVDDKLAKLTDRQAAKEKDHMMQAMMADRFQLKVHPVVRDATLYELVVAKGGPKLQKSKPAPAVEGATASSEPTMSEHCDKKEGCELDATHFHLKDFADMISGQVPTSVTDKTGLSGEYDFTFRWAPDSFRGPTDDSVYPVLFTALKEQLGLELKPVKGTVDALVIDHIEKPSEN